MRRVILQFFQLFLAIFIIYAMLYNFPNGILLIRIYKDLILFLHQHLLVSLLCLICMFLIGKWKKAGGIVSDIPAYREPNQPLVFHAK